MPRSNWTSLSKTMLVASLFMMSCSDTMLSESPSDRPPFTIVAAETEEMVIPTECDGELIDHDGEITTRDHAPEYLVCLRSVSRALMVDIEPFDTLEEIKDLRIFKNLTSIGSLQVNDTRYLESLGGLENLKGVAGISIVNNAELKNIKARGGLNGWATGLEINKKNKLETLSGLSSTLGFSHIYIINNDSLRTLEDMTLEFSDPHEARAVLEITDNDSLESVASPAFEDPPDVFRKIVIRDNDKLRSLAETEALKNASDIELGGERLEDLATMRDIDEVGVLDIYGPSLPNLDDLSSLREVLTLLRVSGMTTMEDLSDLAGLEYVSTLQLGSCRHKNAQLTFMENPELRTLDGLSPDAVVSNVMLAANPSLSDIEAFRTDDDKGYHFAGAINNPLLTDEYVLDVLVGTSTGAYAVCGNLDSKNEDIVQGCWKPFCPGPPCELWTVTYSQE